MTLLLSIFLLLSTALSVSALDLRPVGGSNFVSGAISVGSITIQDNALDNTYIRNLTAADTTTNTITSGQNTGIGFRVLLSNTTGMKNTAAGHQAMQSNTTGIDNTAYGFYALLQNTTGVENTAIGDAALLGNTTGNTNTAVGTDSFYSFPYPGNGTGSFNVGLGKRTGFKVTTGSANTIIGTDAGFGISTASNNICLGNQACSANATANNSEGANGLTTGNNNIIIGYNINPITPTGSNTLNIGNIIFGTGLTGTDTTIVDALIGIGTNAPASKLHIVANSSTNTGQMDAYNNAASNGFVLRTARGSVSSPTAVQSGDILAGYSARGYGTTGFSASARVSVNLVTAETWTDTAQGTYMSFYTTKKLTNTLLERMRIDDTGTLVLGAGGASTGLGGGVLSKGVTFVNLGTPDNGMIIFCTDCDPATAIDQTCTHVGGQTGSLAIRANGAWKCVS